MTRPVALKRVLTQKAEQNAIEEDRGAKHAEPTQLEQVAFGQLVSDREVLKVILERIGRGQAKRDNQAWDWVEPDWGADPNSWPPLAKLTWLIVRSHHLMADICLRNDLRRPSFCRDCEGDKEFEEPWHQMRCEKHQCTTQSAKTLATSLGWRADDSKKAPS